MKKVLVELKNNNVDLMGLVKTFEKGETTKLNGEALVYKNIPEALMFLINYKHGQEVEFKNSFDNFGTMIDVSRGAVFNLQYLKKLIRQNALMGVNEFWMYIEDIYEVEKYPVFGYMRGKYSLDEIKEIVEYAEMFGITVIPAIQTLGHMEQFLRWLSQTTKFKDQPNVLLARDEGTRDLIFEMLKTIKEMFKTDKIHVGLDETWGFGLGTFFKKNGFVPQMELFLEHLNIVNEMALEVGFKDVLIWSDMFFRFMSETNSYYDTRITFDHEVISKIPENVSLVYWDYYNRDQELVSKMLKNHIEVTDKVIFASGTWIWTKFSYDKRKTDSIMEAHINASIENNVKDFILTQWMDDGAFGNHETTVLGVYEASLKALTNCEVNENVYKEIAGEDYKITVDRSLINYAKFTHVALLWDDPLFSVYLNSFTNNDPNNFQHVLDEFEVPLKTFKDDEKYLYEYSIVAANYNKVLGRKAMVEGFKKGKIEADEYYLNVVKHLENLINVYRERWYRNYKMYGFEVIQSRLELQIARAKEMIIISKMFNNKEITHIDGLNDKVDIYDQYLFEKHSLIAFTTKPA